MNKRLLRSLIVSCAVFTFLAITLAVTDASSVSAKLNSTAQLDSVDSVRVVQLTTNDIIFNPSDQKIYASVPSSVGAGGNSITTINPLTGATGTSVFVGSEPSQLQLANDGQTLYVYLAGAFAIQRYNFVSQTPAARFSLGQDSFFGLYNANDFSVAPNDPELIAVSRYYLGTSPPQGGVAIFKSGVQLPQTGPGHIEGCHYTVFAVDGATLYGSNDYGIKTMTVGPTGVTVQNSTVSAGAHTRLKLANGIIYTSGGQLIDTNTHALLGTFPGASSNAFVPDPSVGRAYYLVRNTSVPNAWNLNAYDLTTFTLIGTMTINNVQGDATSMVRWGTNGLAFRTTTNQVFLVQTSLIPTANPLPSPPAVPTPTPTPTPLNSATFFRQIDLPANDVVYSGSANSLLLSVPGSAGAGTGNTITNVDPTTGQITGSYFIGSEPNKLAISNDGQTLYATLDGANAIRRYDVPTHTPGLQFTPNTNFLHPRDMKVAPGTPNILAVASGYNGVGIFDNGVQRPNVSNGGAYALDSIDFSSDPNTIYGYDNESSGFELSKLTVTSQGVTGSLIGENLLCCYSSRISYADGKLYATSGRVIDPETKQVTGTYQLGQNLGNGAAVAVDANSNRVYYLTGNVLSTFDRSTFIKLGSVTLPFNTTPVSLIRWGTNGLAIKGVGNSSDGHVYILQSALVDPSAPVPTGIMLSTNSYSAFEGGQPVTVTVMRTGDLSQSSSIDFATVNGTAVAGADFVSQSGTLTFAPGESSKNISIQIINDNVYEGTESFGITLSNPTGSGVQLLSPNTATITLSDNDSRPFVSASGASVTEPPLGGTRQVNVQVQLSNPSVEMVSVNYSTANGTAQAGLDYLAANGTLSFGPLETVKTVSVPILGDSLFEGNETFTVNLSSPVNASINTGQVVVTIRNFNNTAHSFDFDGDGKTDVSIFRPQGASGGAEWWYQRSSDSQVFSNQFGVSTDKPVPADFTGDGKTDIAFWRPSDGQWFILRSEDFSFFAFPFGGQGDIPMPADYDGDGKADAAVFRPSSATWFVLRSSDGQVSFTQFGAQGDQPVAADYDGDGKADIAIYRPGGANGAEWWIQRSSNQSVFALQFGSSTDKAVPGDYTGDGKADIAFWRPSDGQWFVLRSEDFSFFAFPWGVQGDIPAPGDYDGDGKTDAAVFRPNAQTWFINRSSQGPQFTGFGLATDQPVPNVFVR